MNKTFVLVVEDEEFLAKAIKDNLEAEGYAVEVAGNADDALARIRESRPSLILCDLLLPQKSGFHIIEEVKKNLEWKTIPIIMLTSLSGDVEIKKALHLGADDFFVKSQHTIEEVVKIAKEYMEGRRKARFS